MLRCFASFRTSIRRLVRDQRGIALVEFAFAIPILIIMYLGTFQLCDAIAAYRKVTTTARAITDLTAQYQSVSTADLDDILNASTQVMAPYDVRNATFVVSQINIDASGNGRVGWSQGKNASGRAIGSAFSVPAAIATPNTSLIFGEATYTYAPMMAPTIMGTINMADRTYMNPRLVTSIPKV